MDMKLILSYFGKPYAGLKRPFILLNWKIHMKPLKGNFTYHALHFDHAITNYTNLYANISPEFRVIKIS